MTAHALARAHRSPLAIYKCLSCALREKSAEVTSLVPKTKKSSLAVWARVRNAKRTLRARKEESTEDLRLKLAQFYASRTLTNEPITPEDQAEAIYFMCSDKSSKTTGIVFNVDGGLHEAFVR